jgi:hypothetical protein
VTVPTGTPRAPAADWRLDADFAWPEKQPWSVLGPQFALAFGNADPDDPQPENLEVFGQNGSGKSHAVGKIYQERAFVQQRPSIIFAHKPIDKTMLKIGFPIATSWDELTKNARDGHINQIYWPRTRLMGAPRKAYYDRMITDVLDRLWASVTEKTPADTDIIIDDAAYAEKLPETRERIEQYLREGRAPGFSTAILKQRVQGGTRLTSSEAQWTLGFRPKDDDDCERWSQMFGSKRQWMPVLRSLDWNKREFILKHSRSGVAYISWMDQPLVPMVPPRKRRTVRDWLGIG